MHVYPIYLINATICSYCMVSIRKKSFKLVYWNHVGYDSQLYGYRNSVELSVCHCGMTDSDISNAFV